MLPQMRGKFNHAAREACRKGIKRSTQQLSEQIFRHALWQIAETIPDLSGQVSFLAPVVGRMPDSHGPTWAELTKRWNSGGS